VSGGSVHFRADGPLGTVSAIDDCKARLAAAWSEIGDGIVWYQYDILASLAHVDALLHGENRNLGRLAAG
jgi:hypothetical protein